MHVEHGVGRFLGFDTKTVGGVTRDYVNLQFKGEDRLFVPHDQLAKLSRYIGADGRPPALSKLGGKAWHTLRSRARAAVHELAGELLRLYAVRQTRTREPYADEEGWLERLERAFPYTETEDQGRAIDEVLEDLTGEQPMDRLICGDVGFGKTEVAMRAAFLVAISGRQVLVLAPTTLLVQQHLQTFRDRFRDFPVRVEAVSRMREAGDVKKALRAFCEGKIEVLIGTHRLLSRDVIPQQLGLDRGRRGAALRRAAEGAAAPAAARGRRALDVGDADSAHAAHVAGGIARHLGDRDPAARAPADPHARGRVRRDARRGGAAPRDRRARGRSSTCTTASRRSTRRPRSSAGSCPRRASASGTARWTTARWSRRWWSSCAATSTCSWRPRSSRAGSTSRRSTRSSSSAPTCSGWPSCTRSAAASAVARTPRTPT